VSLFPDQIKQLLAPGNVDEGRRSQRANELVRLGRRSWQADLSPEAVVWPRSAPGGQRAGRLALLSQQRRTSRTTPLPSSAPPALNAKSQKRPDGRTTDTGRSPRRRHRTLGDGTARASSDFGRDPRPNTIAVPSEAMKCSAGLPSAARLPSVEIGVSNHRTKVRTRLLSYEHAAARTSIVNVGQHRPHRG